MLDVLEGKLRSGQVTNVTTQRVDLDCGDVLEGSYDLVVSTMTLHHVREIPSLLKQFATVLKSGGHLCIADLDPDDGNFHDDKEGVFHSGFDRNSLRNLLADAGFVDIRDRSAAEVVKPDTKGDVRVFSVFLISGCRA
jgi:ubiquinone/menaquinone biosynthesis C-methylase UbiE